MRAQVPIGILLFWIISGLAAQEPSEPRIRPNPRPLAESNDPNPLRFGQGDGVPSLREFSPESTGSPTLPMSAAPVRPWIHGLGDELRSGDPFRAIAAVARLREMGADGAAALVDLLRTNDAGNSVTWSALRALDDLGPAAVPALIQAMEKENDRTRLLVEQILRRLGPDAALATPALSRMLRDPDADGSRRLQAASLLADIGPAARVALPDLLDVFEHEQNEELRREALRAMAAIGNIPAATGERLLPVLTNEQEDAGIRVAVSDILVQQQPRLPAVVPSLIRLLNPSHGEEVCCAALASVARLGPEAVDALPALQSLLQHESEQVRKLAAQAIGGIGVRAGTVSTTLVQLAQRDDDESMRHVAGQAIGSLGQEAVSDLMRGLSSTELTVRTNTLAALAAMGPPAKEATRPIVNLLEDPAHANVHVECIRALEAIRAETSLAAGPLLRAVANPSRALDVRVAAANALHPIGASADAVLPLMSQVLRNRLESAQLRAAAAFTLGKISPSTVPELIQALRDDSLEVRLAAAKALCLHQDGRQQGLAAMIRELAFPENVESVALVLEWAGPPAIPMLGIVLRDRNASLEHRVAAANVLGRIGGQSGEWLVAALSDEDAEVVTAAERALYEVGPRDAVPPLLVAINRHVATNPQSASPRHQRLLQRMRQLIVDLNGPLGGPSGGHPDIASSDGRGVPRMAPVPANEIPAHSAMPSEPDPAGGAAPPPADRDGSPAIDVTARAGGAEQNPAWKTVKVFYGTNRKPVFSLAQRRQLQWQSFLPVMIGCITMLLSAAGFLLSRSPMKAAFAGLGLALTLVLAYPAARRTVQWEQSAVSRPGPMYGTESTPGVEVGVCEVTIPASHSFGKLESPSLIKLEVTADPLKHIVLRSVDQLDNSDFHSQLKQHLADCGSSIFVFVHGYNVQFDDAARRTAQMASDLEFPGAPIFFSWPSQGNWYEYREDERQVELAVEPLKQFLLEISERSGAKSIHLVAHSMGNRALTAALREMELHSAAHRKVFNQVVLAAPDIDADVFRQRIVPAIQAKAERVTLYASSNDLALVASRTFNSGDRRAGDSSHGLLILPGIETIDVSQVDTSLLGHSYYGNNPTVLTDLKDLLLHARSADQRAMLEPILQNELRYWIFRAAKAISRTGTDEQTR